MHEYSNGTAARSDDLDSADYDPLVHLNTIFSHSSTLSSASAISRAIKSHQNDLDTTVSRLVTAQASDDAASIQRIRDAQSELQSLFTQIKSVRERALHTELTIAHMTADIKRLDGTKRNLTLSMTALKRLQMLTTAYEQLRALQRTGQYRDCAQLLLAVIQLMAHFKSYRSIPQIATLGKKVVDLQTELLEQVCADFQDAFDRGDVRQRRATLAEACLIVDALGDAARSRLVTWYCNTTLREYRQIFRGNDEAGSLDNISRRYAWFNRILKAYDADHAAIFPLHWRVNEMLANAFCEGTRDDFKAVLQRSVKRGDGQTLDVNLLLSCLQETLDFEHALERRFTGDTRSSIDTVTSTDDKPRAFQQAISEAFEPYLSLWVESQDRHLASLIPLYRQQPLHNPDEDFSQTAVIPSSTELFQIYRLDLAQCAKLSTGNRLLQLTQTFAKYLDAYSQQVLLPRLTDHPPTLQDAITTLNTADYCSVTTTQLALKITSRIDVEHRPIDLTPQSDLFLTIASASLRSLTSVVLASAEPSLREMRATSWTHLTVTSQSRYIPLLTSAVRDSTSSILTLLSHVPHYARAFCDGVVDALLAAHAACISACKPIDETGAEQMLLDSHEMKALLASLPSLGSHAPPSAAYARRTTAAAARLDPLLKTLAVRSAPPEGLVTAYLVHVADSSEANFRGVLELKGVPRREQGTLLELFAAHVAGTPGLSASSALMALVMAPVQGAAQAGKFDVGAMLSAGAERFGSPVGGEKEREVEGQTSVNDNLRNIGKFFKRDIGPFGRFGGKGDGAK